MEQVWFHQCLFMFYLFSVQFLCLLSCFGGCCMFLMRPGVFLIVFTLPPNILIHVIVFTFH